MSALAFPGGFNKSRLVSSSSTPGISNASISVERPPGPRAAGSAAAFKLENRRFSSTAVPAAVVPGALSPGIGEVFAIAGVHKYDLGNVVHRYEGSLGQYRIGLCFPRTRSASDTRLIIPLEVVVLQDAKDSEAAIFSDGTIVAFGMSAAEIKALIEDLAECRSSADDVAWVGEPETVHRFRFTTIDALPGLGFDPPADMADSSYIDEGALDAIVLQSASLEAKLPFMYCLSRRVQIDAVQAALKPVVERIRGWRRVVSNSGTLPFEVKDCRIQRARVMRLAAAQTRISQRPRIFTDSDYSHLRQLYGLTCYYFELHERSEALRDKLATAAEAINYFGESATRRIDIRLEWVIILLLVIEASLHRKTELLAPFKRMLHGEVSEEAADAAGETPLPPTHHH
jgi:uncharacterized Rmd1/YagE family protein